MDNKTHLNLNTLVKTLERHKKLYYEGKAEISDYDYDQLEEQLRSLNPQHPFLNKVGSSLKSNVSKKVPHERKMLSLQKTYEKEKLIQWIGKEDVLGFFKVDGSSCSLVYESGKLVLAKTRGDGEFGEDITDKVKYIKTIPKEIAGDNSFSGEVRGEIYCTNKKFQEVTVQMKSCNLALPTAQRNIVAGLLGRKTHLDLCQYLDFFAFEYFGKKVLTTEIEKKDYLTARGFIFPHHQYINNNQQLDNFIQSAIDMMGNSQSYLIDGLVLSYNSLKLHEELGETSHHPRYKIAFKFQGLSKVTTIKDITWGVSRNGVCTPVATVEPVELSQAIVHRVTLHNLGIVKQFQLKRGDEIEIIRSGEVIPKFLSVVQSSDQPFQYPNKCPSCNFQLDEDGIWLKCINDQCTEKVKGSIHYYVKQVGIDGLSDKRLDGLIENGILKSIPDLYKIKREQLLSLGGYGEKLTQNIIEGIDQARSLSLLKFLAALGIDGGGKSTCEKIIVAGYDTLDKVLGLTSEQLSLVEGFAQISSEKFIDSLQEKRSVIDLLVNKDEPLVKIASPEHSPVRGAVSEMTFCITGTLSRKRSEVESAIKGAGGRIVSAVSAQTNYLVTNDVESSSSKFKKAKKLEVPIINEQKLDELLNEN